MRENRSWGLPTKRDSAKETYQKANNKAADQTAQIHRLVCAFVVRIESQVFSCQGPYDSPLLFIIKVRTCLNPCLPDPQYGK